MNSSSNRKGSSWPKISAITPSLNQGNYLERTILSVLAQDYPNLEYMVLDGGSTDNSVAIMNKYASFFSFYRSKKDDGQASAIREGFERATGDILCWLNSDDIMMPFALNAIGSFFRDNPDVNIVAGHCFYINQDDVYLKTAHSIVQTYRHMLNYGLMNSQPAMFWTKNLYEKVGGINSSFKYCMDYDLFVRMLKKGNRIYTISKTLAAFRQHPDSKGSTMRHIGREELMVIRKCHLRHISIYSDYLYRARQRIRREFERVHNFISYEHDAQLWKNVLSIISKKKILI